MFREKEFLGKRRDRAIATILSFKEDNCDEFLPDDISDDLRYIILSQINDVCDFAFDLLNDDIDFNEHFLNRLDEIVNG